jgi:ABC-type nitrate/sulfonate/bicarbonate transport system substrate-binding protein
MSGGRRRAVAVASRWLLRAGLAAALATPVAALDKVVVAYRQEITSADIFIALEEGFFAQEGVEIEAVTWNGGMESLPLLAQGRIDFMPTGTFSVAYVNLIQRGGRVRLVRARGVHTAGRCDYRSFIARSELIDSGQLDDLSAIRGRRVSASRTDNAYFYWAMLLEKAGLTFDDVTLNFVATSGLQMAISRGLVDVGVQGEPALARTLESGDAKIWIPINRILPDYQASFLLFGPSLLDERPEVGRRVVAALQKAVDQYLDPAKYERNVEILARRTRMPAEEVRAMCWPGWSADGVIDRKQLDAFQRWARGEGFIDAVVASEDLVDSRFLLLPGAPDPEDRVVRPGP